MSLGTSYARASSSKSRSSTMCWLERGMENKKPAMNIAGGWPVISVDTKKKELVGNFENRGRQWRRKRSGERVKSHDFPDPSVPRAYPYGIYDLGQNTGFVNVGTDHDT